ncbi:hypothetical protein [Cellulomonas marina]|uniref:Uncharacterized protein n=1 Tax=Cellulomonas marina TaxID=988821 RepID=A0A1I0YM36_9CELL|nr:hypothetical protein [Cellulomonas marina]GIG27634.1 hypothetical protein Cma02nite_02340 [Cellulomonas marina]SFB14475.1 hypothetical protein SAMN05421867_10840 [Cellulomonas marina]
MLEFLESHRVLAGAVGCIVALAVAVVFLLVVPEEAAGSTGARYLVLRYGHSLCWLLLAACSALHALRAPSGLVEATGLLALASYVSFVAVLLSARGR